MARPQNSSPLSVRSTRGRPRVSASRSRTRVTASPPSARAGMIATASVVASSTIAKHFNTPLRRAIKNEVGPSPLVRHGGFLERLTVGDRHFLATTPPDLQTLRDIQAMDA